MAETEARSPGRPRQFDEETALDQLTELFWEQGFSRTSVTDLVEASGVHKPSLYRTFGSKEELFVTILRRYFEDRMAFLRSIVEGSGPGVEGIEAFLDTLLEAVLSDGADRGCLLVASSTELRGTITGFEDFGASYRRSLRSIASELASKAGGTDDEIEGRSHLIITWLMGIDVIVRGGADRTEIEPAFAAFKATVSGWRS